VVETERPPEVERALEFPAAFEATTRRMLQYGQCCAETAELLLQLLQFDPMEDTLRQRIERLRRQQAVVGKLFVRAAMDATEAMKAKEAEMLELPLGDDENAETPQAFR